MLCGVLLNAPTIRRFLLVFLAKQAGIDPRHLDDLDWNCNTEQAIGSKRDDLRLEGWKVDDEDLGRVVLWTIEAKVAAPIHQSSEQLLDDEDDTLSDAERAEDAPLQEEADTATVSQIKKYDHWLARQDATHRAGFVLAITDQTENLPPGLQMPWQCTTWTDLALVVEHALAEDGIPASELVLARHMCGFIRDHLWNEVDMSTHRLGFDDLALLRAFEAKGHDCDRRVGDLVASLKDTVCQANIIRGEIRLQKKLFGSINRVVQMGRIVPEAALEPSPWLVLMAGVAGANAHICIESSPGHDAKADIRRIVCEMEPALIGRNSQWAAEPDDGRSYPDIVLEVPLTWLLLEADQDAALNQFMAKGLADLKEVGLVAALDEEMRRRGTDI